jgi:hypothetical protein
MSNQKFLNKTFLKKKISDKAGKKEEIDEVLDAIYALFIVVHLKRIWKQHHLFFKFMEFLPNKRKKKDDSFFVSYLPP